MQITRHTDYSLRTLMYLAALPEGELGNVAEIAKGYDISRNHLVKIVHNLGRLGYIETRRGRGGGIALNLPPDEIKLGDLVQSAEQSMEPIDCNALQCPLACGCSLYNVMHEAVAAYLEVLNRYTLQDIVTNKITYKNLQTIIKA